MSLNLAIETLGVARDVSASLGFPIVSPILTCALSLTKKILERTKYFRDKEVELVHLNSRAQDLAHRLNNQLLASPNDSLRVLLSEYQRLNELLHDLEETYQRSSSELNGKAIKRNKVQRIATLTSRLQLIEELKRDIALLASITITAQLESIRHHSEASYPKLDAMLQILLQMQSCISEVNQHSKDAARNSAVVPSLLMDSHSHLAGLFAQGMQDQASRHQHTIPGLASSMESRTGRDSDGCKYLHMEDLNITSRLHIPLECRQKDTQYLLGRLRGNTHKGQVLVIKRFMRRDPKFEEAVELQKRHLMQPNIAQIIGYSSEGAPFMVLKAGQRTFKQTWLDSGSVQWQWNQLLLRMMYQVSTVCVYLGVQLRATIWYSICDDTSTMPLIDSDGQLQIDVDLIQRDVRDKEYLKLPSEENARRLERLISCKTNPRYKFEECRSLLSDYGACYFDATGTWWFWRSEAETPVKKSKVSACSTLEDDAENTCDEIYLAKRSRGGLHKMMDEENGSSESDGGDKNTIYDSDGECECRMQARRVKKRRSTTDSATTACDFEDDYPTIV